MVSDLNVKKDVQSPLMKIEILMMITGITFNVGNIYCRNKLVRKPQKNAVACVRCPSNSISSGAVVARSLVRE